MDSKSFSITLQESLLQEKIHKNGRPLELHTVAKNIAFSVHLKSTFDLTENPVHARLIYDFDEEGKIKDVDTVKSAPLEYTTHVDESGLEAVVEVKISVLSSQHDAANFRVLFICSEPDTNEVVSDYTQPIRVLSKRNQVKKSLEKKHTKTLDLTTIQKKEKAPSSTTSPLLMETLQRMEEQQKEQTKLINQLLYQPISKSFSIPDPNEMEFEAAFNLFLSSYTKIPQEKRATKIRKVLIHQKRR